MGTRKRREGKLREGICMGRKGNVREGKVRDLHGC